MWHITFFFSSKNIVIMLMLVLDKNRFWGFFFPGFYYCLPLICICSNSLNSKSYCSFECYSYSQGLKEISAPIGVLYIVTCIAYVFLFSIKCMLSRETIVHRPIARTTFHIFFYWCLRFKIIYVFVSWNTSFLKMPMN